VENKSNLDGFLKDKYSKGVTEQMAKPNAKAPLGQGGRFAALKQKLSKQGASSPGGLAAYIGRKKYGNKGFARLASRGKKG
jgi:hypothetical protein